VANGDPQGFQGLPGLLSDPVFNLGIGLLGSGLSRPRTFGEGLLGGFQAGGQLQNAALRNQTARERLEEMARRRQAGSAVQELIEGLGPVAPDFVGPPQHGAGTLSAPQAGALGSLAQLDPSAALQQLVGKGGLLAPEPREFRTDIGKLFGDRDLAEQAGNAAAVQAIEQTIQQQLGPDVDLTKIRQFRNDTVKNSGEFLQEKAAFERIQAGVAQPSAAGDVALVFNFMKLLDPGSTVREGEFATAEAAAGIPERVRNLYNKALTGERLSDRQRADFLSQARKQFESASERQQRLVEDARQFAERNKLSVQDVVPEFILPRALPAPGGQVEQPRGRIDLGNGVIGEFID
jgi:hypothetical protein